MDYIIGLVVIHQNRGFNRVGSLIYSGCRDIWRDEGLKIARRCGAKQLLKSNAKNTQADRQTD
jgi:hypothetical protein